MRRFIILLLFLCGCASSQSLQISSSRPVSELIKEALQKSPPAENVTFKETDLTEVIKLDSTIHTDIRYATENNFLSTPLYSQARAFLQRPAAEAVVRANQKLKLLGYGLLIHDAYRPWYITKIFWDATPEKLRDFVADPSKGSRHNRGCAVDLTLYDLKTGKTVKMPSQYDEMSELAYPDYKGGTYEERKLRDLLRSTMETEGFTVFKYEWWHFDYKDFESYAIQNVRFEDIHPHKN